MAASNAFVFELSGEDILIGRAGDMKPSHVLSQVLALSPSGAVEGSGVSAAQRATGSVVKACPAGASFTDLEYLRRLLASGPLAGVPCAAHEAMVVCPEPWFASVDALLVVGNLFIDLGFRAIHLQRPSVCCALRMGYPTAVSVDVTDSVSTVTAVVDGQALRRGQCVTPHGLTSINAALQTALGDNEGEAIVFGDSEAALTLPEPPSDAAARFAAEQVLTELRSTIAKPEATKFTTASGREVVVSAEQVSGAVDILLGREANLADAITKAIFTVDCELRNSFPVVMRGSQRCQFLSAALLDGSRRRDASMHRLKKIDAVTDAGVWQAAGALCASAAFASMWVLPTEVQGPDSTMFERKLLL